MHKLTQHVFLLALAGALLTSCAGLIGPRDLEIPLSKMQGGLDRRFPLHNRALELFEIELSHPQLTMQPDSGRMAMAMEALVAPPFTRKTWHGTLMLSGRLVIDPVRNAVLMAEPRVDSFTVDGVDEGRQRNLAKAANLLMHNVVDGVPLYQFRPEDLRYGGVQFVPTRITPTERGLTVSVEPAH